MKQQSHKKFFFLFFPLALMNERVNLLTFSFQKVCWSGALDFLLIFYLSIVNNEREGSGVGGRNEKKRCEKSGKEVNLIFF